MALKYALFENHLTEDPSDYMAVVQLQASKSQEDVIDLMIGRGSTVTKAEALSVLEEYAAAIEQLLREGQALNTPLFNLSPTIKGVFTSEDESYNAATHTVKINVTPGKRLKQVANEIEVQRVAGVSPQPDLLYVDDLGSGTRNEQLTPGNIARLKGSRLKFDPTDPLQGIFLVSEANAETRISTVSRNKPAQLDFLVPAVAPGLYKLVVRTLLKNTKTIRSGTLQVELNIIA